MDGFMSIYEEHTQRLVEIVIMNKFTLGLYGTVLIKFYLSLNKRIFH